MRVLFFATVLALSFASCKRETDIKQTCYKGRFVAEGCWTVVQILEPLDNKLPTSQYGQYEHSIGMMGLPEQYKNDEPFYFKINSVDSNKIYLTYCLATKYFVDISFISDTPCDQNNK